MPAGPLAAACRAAAAPYALALAALTLLPSDPFVALGFEMVRKAMVGPDGRTAALGLAIAAGLLLPLAWPRARAAAATDRPSPLHRAPTVAPRLRLSRPLRLTLLACVLGPALIASGDLSAAVDAVAAEGGLSASLDHAARHLAPDHLLPYAVLGLLLALGWGSYADPWLPGLAALALSGGLELLQAAIPGRAPSAWDLLSNALGLAAGLALAGVLLGRSRCPAPRRSTGAFAAPACPLRGATLLAPVAPPYRIEPPLPVVPATSAGCGTGFPRSRSLR